MLDWRAQEFGIGAGLAGDVNMMEAYNSEDSYIAFGIQAKQLPHEATEKTHGALRDRFKTCVLGTQYGIGAQALAARIDQPDIVGRDLLRYHHKVYKRFWQWADNRVNRSFLYNSQDTVFGWSHRFLEHPKANSVRNFFMQANGAEMCAWRVVWDRKRDSGMRARSRCGSHHGPDSPGSRKTFAGCEPIWRKLPPLS